MKISYASTSPYAKTPQSDWAIGSYVHMKIPASSDDELYTIEKKYEFRPQLLSQSRYGTPEYWWVFTARNIGQLRDPIFDLKEGVTIVVPSLATIRRAKGE